MAEKPTMNQEEAARALGLSRETLRKGVASGDIPAMRLEDRWVFSRRGIETFLATGTWPKANPEPAEIAELVVKALIEKLAPAFEALKDIAADADELPRGRRVA